MGKRIHPYAPAFAVSLFFAVAHTAAAGTLLYVGDGSQSAVVTFQVTGSTATLLGSSAPPWGTLETPSPMLPQGMAIGPGGNLYVADADNGQVDVFDGASGQFLSTLISGLFDPTGLAFGPDGNLYVTDSPLIGGLGPFGAVAEFTPAGASLGYFLAPQAPVSGSPVGFLSPNGIAFGPDGALYAADTLSGTIVRITASGAATFTSLVSAHNYMSNPFQLVFGPDGNLYVTDTTDNVVYEFNGSTGALLAIIGQNIVGGNVVGTLLGQPTALGFHGGNMYVGDNLGRIATFDSSGNELADLVTYPDLISPEYLQFADTGTPEPSTWALFGLGLLSMGAVWKRRCLTGA